MTTTIKQIRRLFLLLCLVVAGAQSAWAEDQLYARINTAYHTMEIHYDEMFLANMTSEEISFLAKEEGFYIEQWLYEPEIYHELGMVEKIIFYYGFQNAPITSTHNWFRELTSLTTISNFYDFPTTVTDMSGMFKDCTSLTNVDLSGMPVNNVTDMSGMFSGCRNLTSLNLSGWNTAKLTNMKGMFYGCSSLTTLNMSGWTNTVLTDMSGIFSDYRTLTSIDLTDFNTSAATNMSGMFSGSNSLTSLDLSSFNTANVTNMKSMFQGCSQLASISYGSNWNIGNVTDMSYMFANCTNVTTINLNSYNPISVTNMNHMFSGCTKLTAITYGSNWNTGNVTDMSYMFANCIVLGSLNMSSWNTASVTDMNHLFSGCHNLSSISYGSDWNTGNVTDMSYMFENCSTFTTINLSNYNTPNVTNMAGLFKGCSKLTYVNKGSNFNTSNVTNMSSMFEDCSALTNHAIGSVSNVTNMNSMFRGCTSLTNVVLNYWYTSNVTKMDDMFSGCSKLTSISFGTGWDTSNVTSMGGMFEGCSSLTSIDLGSFNTSNVTSMSYMFSGCSTLTTLNLTSLNTSNVIGMSYMFSDCSALTTLDLTGFDTSAATAMNSMFRGCSNLTTIDGISSWNTSNVTNMGYMFTLCSALTNLDLSNWNTSSVRNLEGMFQGCNHLATITGISKWKTPNLGGRYTDKLNNMFKDCSALINLDLSGWNTSGISEMDYMFSGCSNLVTLNLGGWDTSGAEQMDGMFENCSTLTTIYVGNGWTVYNVSVFNTLFANCTSLVGGNGTRWNSSHIDKTYARIDAPDTPGYFTETSDESYAVYTPDNTTLTFYCDVLRTSHTGTTYDLPTGSNAPGWSATSSAVTSVVFDASFANARPKSTYRWFSGMGKLSSIDGIGNLNTSQVTVMSEMFYGCTQLGNLDLTNFNTSNVTDMSSVFRNCSALTCLDLTGWNTKKVTDMSNMFRECSVLEAIYVDSNWSTQAVTSSNNMFSNCTQLVGGYGTPYDAGHVDMSYAHIDNSASPGYLRDHSQEHNVNLVLVAGVCDKDIEVWNGKTQVGSISKDGGTLYETINNATTLQLRVPNQYLEKITINGKDVTTTLSSTTPDDPDYQGYEFYTVKNLTDVIVIEVQYNDNVPVPFATSSIRFETYNGTGSVKNMKVWFEDGTSMSDNIARPVPFGIGWGNMRTISRIEITMQPDLDNFAYAQQYNTLGTIVDNGDGTYFYTISGENLTSSIIPLYFPTSDHGSVKTMISSKNDFKLGYYFGEWINMEEGFLPEYDQTNTSVLNNDVTVMHFDTHNYQAQGGGYSTGIIFVQVTQGTPFRLTEDGEDYTEDCVWCDANQTFTASPLPISYTCPVAGYYYLLKNVTTDSYIIVDNGSGEVVSPWQILQTASVVGKGTLSLLDSEGTVVKSVSGDEPTTVSWTKGDALKLRATAPEGSDLTNAQAHLFLDNDHCLMTKMTEGGNTYFEYTINEVTSAHSFILVFSGLENGGDDMLTQSVMLLGDNINSPSCVTIEWHDKNGGTYDDYQADWSDLMETSSVEKDRVNGCTVYITTSKGGSYKVFFNGQEITSFTADGGTPGSDFYTASFEDPSMLVDGTWVVVFKEGGITWKAIATGNIPEGASAEFIMDEDSETPMDIEVNNATSYGRGTYLSNQLPPDIQLYVKVPAGYQFKVWFNGEEYTNRYWLFSTSDEGVQSWSYYTSDTDGITPLAIDGTWVVEFKKAEEEGITWSAMAIGDVAEGNRMVAMGYEDMLEVAIDNGKQYDTLTYEPQDETANMSINVLVKEGYNFRIWFNEMECTDKFANVETLSDGRVRWRFDSSDASVVAPYLQDGRWIILFYDDAEHYDLNNDKKVDISDVTKLVNEILNKEQNNNDD